MNVVAVAKENVLSKIDRWLDAIKATQTVVVDENKRYETIYVYTSMSRVRIRVRRGNA